VHLLLLRIQIVHSLIVADDRHVPAAQHDHLLSARLAQRDWILAHIWCSYAQNLEVSSYNALFVYTLLSFNGFHKEKCGILSTV
jgi:hypothetical protein